MRPRLRSLELHGYKTFASRTIFEFPGAITAIVGPNGSGKSNIADAIRWVLGEQAYSLLRAKKTDDMIYLGSEFRPRSSMALASVIFDNDDSWLPIDFSEVAISRRAYRDGDNEYLLNGQRIRLKEITELLSQSGLAERTYTIIGQGSVDAALSLRPEERRRFFEEAAGIGLYRTRREEALNRLDTTRRNLERVRDILGELEPRLNGLEKQARKVQEYERIKADLRLLLRDWYGFHWHKSQNELAHTREVVRSQENQLNIARENQAVIDRQIDAIRTRIQSIRVELNSWHEESAGLHRQWEDLNKNLAVLEEREKATQEQLHSSDADLVHLDEEQKSLMIQNQTLQSDLEKTRTDLDEAKNQENAARSEFDKSKQDRDEKEKILENQRKRLLAAETRQVQYKSRNEELNTRLENLQTSLAGNAGAQDESRKDLDGATLEITSISRGLEDSQKSLTELQVKKSKFLKERTDLETEIKSLQEKELQQRAVLAKYKAQIDVLEQSERSLVGFAEGSKSILTAANRGELSGKFIPLTSRIEVQPEFETAIAAVFGEILEGILLDNTSDLNNVLTLLETGDKGRAILITKITGKQPQKSEPLNHPSVLYRAEDVIRVNEDLKIPLHSLLDGVYITQDRAGANEIVNLLPHWGKVVTLNGEVFSGSGTITAGKDTRVKLLSRPREKHELETESTRLNEFIQKLALEIQKVSEKSRTLSDQVSQCEDEIINQQRLSNEEHSKLQHATLKRDQAQQKLDWIKEQAGIFQEQFQSINAEMNQQAENQNQNEIEMRQFREESESTIMLVKNISLDSLQIQLTHWTTQVAVYAQAFQQISNRLAEKEAMISSLHDRKVGIEARSLEFTATLEKTRNEISDLKSRGKDLSERISILTEKINPLESEIGEKEKEYNALQDTQNAARMAFQIADRHTSQAQLDMSRQKDALESLRNRIEEDFGLVAFEYTHEINGPTPLPLEGMVEQLPVVKELPPAYEENINRQKTQLRRMGPVNLDAQKEFLEVSERFTFLTGQVEDLHKADEDLRQVIAELDELMKREFRKTFDAVAVEFKQMFTRLFNGGQARLELIDEDDPKSAGVDIEARLPGRREQGLSLLSGGEKSLTAVALIFALLKISPTPFCILDEVDAMLDEANVGRFCDLLKELSENTQFIIITHNRNTVQVADVIYGVTMAKDSTSQVISLKMDEITDEMIQ